MQDSTTRHLNPYTVFKVDRNFDINAVKSTYRRFALKLHPDRNKDPNAPRLFAAITQCYQKLLEDYCARLADVPHDQRRYTAQEYMQQNQPGTANTNVNLSDSKNFDLNNFNRVFSTHRLEDVHDHGYEAWMKESPAEQAENERKKRESALALHRPIAAHTMDPNSVYELGVTTVSDFSRPVCLDSLGRRSGKGLPYTDYRVAHTTTTMLADNPQNVQSYTSIEQLEVERSKIQYQMSEQDLAKSERERRRALAAENRRVETQQRRDQLAFEQYTKTHRLLLQQR